jgi:hypothetical protein
MSVTIQLSRFCFAALRRLSPLTGDLCSSPSSRTQIGFQLTTSTRRPGSSPGRRGPRVLSLLISINFQDRQLQTSIHPFSHNPVEMTGFEPVAFALQRRCSPAELHPRALPENQVGLTGFEPVTPVLSGLCSNQLSYRPAQARPQQLRSDRKFAPSTPIHRG